jgi:hypothetical protein
MVDIGGIGCAGIGQTLQLLRGAALGIHCTTSYLIELQHAVDALHCVGYWHVASVAW